MDQAAIKHGPVWINTGKHRGQIGYYDDDTEDRAIVYLGEPCKSAWVKIPHHWIDALDSVSSIELDMYKRKNPEVLRQYGL